MKCNAFIFRIPDELIIIILFLELLNSDSSGYFIH